MNRKKSPSARKIISKSPDQSKIGKYQIGKRIGKDSKEGKTYIVNYMGNTYAMKTFKANKQDEKFMEEVEFQRKCASLGISPKIIDYDLEQKYIVMEKMDKHLIDDMKDGLLPSMRQREILRIFKRLDEAKIFHGDSNMLNYMIKDDKIYIIDFGYSKKINSELVEKLQTVKPNFELMLIGFILKLKEFNCPESSYSTLKLYLPYDLKKKYNI